MTTYLKRGGTLAFIGLVLAVLASPFALVTPAAASDYFLATNAQESEATPFDYDRVASDAGPLSVIDADAGPLVIRKTVDLTNLGAGSFSEYGAGLLGDDNGPEYPRRPVYCRPTDSDDSEDSAKRQRGPRCLSLPTVEFKEVGCTNDGLVLQVTATNPNAGGLLDGWAPVELEAVINGYDFGDAVLVPPSGQYVWTFVLPDGSASWTAGFAPQAYLNFGAWSDNTIDCISDGEDGTDSDD